MTEAPALTWPNRGNGAGQLHLALHDAHGHDGGCQALAGWHSWGSLARALGPALFQYCDYCSTTGHVSTNCQGPS